MNKIKLELLSPAKDYASARCAILTGADGVFIGGPAFGARAEANNKLSDLKNVCTLAHHFGCRVHVTLNTLLYDSELEEAQDLIYRLADIGVDVLIVQDLSIFSMKIPRSLELHASTQCCVDTPDKLKFYADLGVSQVVLPREFTLDKIRLFHETCPQVRLEAFVMGALCVSVSGICHISDYLKKRSANRGECAQICRLPMQLFHNQKEIAVGHLLSLKDNLQDHNLKDLIEAGVTCFKIEGRLKDSDYVANTTAFMSTRLDETLKGMPGYERISKGRVTLNFKPDPYKTFNRGFTDGLLTDSKDSLSNDVTPKFTGPKLGRVISVKRRGRISDVTLSLDKRASLVNGDGLCFIRPPKESSDGGIHNVSSRVSTVEGFRVNQVSEGPKGQIVASFMGQTPLKAGDKVFKNYDIEFDSALKRQDFALRELGYDVVLKVENTDGNTCRATLSINDESGRFASDYIEFDYDDKLSALNTEKVEKTLLKRLDPLTRPLSVKIEGEKDKLTLKISSLNDLRRRVLAACFGEAESDSDVKSRDETFENINKEGRVFAHEPYPQYPDKVIDSRLVLNHKARALYEKCGSAIEDESHPLSKLTYDSVMTCRFCLVKQYARCFKDGGDVRNFSLVVSGQKFKIVTDCKNCFMHILRA